MGQVLPVAFSCKGKKLVAIVLPYTCDVIRWDPLLFQCQISLLIQEYEHPVTFTEHLALVRCRNCVGHHSCQDWRSARASCLKVSLFIALHAGCSILFSTVAVDDVQGEKHWTSVENYNIHHCSHLLIQRCEWVGWIVMASRSRLCSEHFQGLGSLSIYTA